MGKRIQLQPPKQFNYTFKPSEKQYELWQALHENCPFCGGEVIKVIRGYDKNGEELYKFQCSSCESENIPQMILGGGSAGGGKSYIGCNWIIECSLRWSGFRSVIARKTLKVLRESTMVTFWKIIKQMGLERDVHYTHNDILGLITFWNGSEVLLKELSPSPQDPTWSRLGGLEIGAVFCDECDELDETAVETLFSRIRWMTWETLKVPKMLLTCNPNLTWVRDRFVLDEHGQDKVCKTGDYYVPFSLFDNPDPTFRATYESSLNRMNKKEKRRLLYGDWRYVEASDLVCYKGFDNTKHLKDDLFESIYDNYRPAILSFDFNTYPYMSCLLIQIDWEKRRLYVLKELLGTPKNKQANTPAHSAMINKALLKMEHEGSVIITGDPAGNQKSTLVAEDVTNYSIILNNLAGFMPTRKLLEKAPAQATRVEWINEIFENEFEGWSIEVDSKCFKLIDDLIYQQKNPDGSKEKKKVWDADAKVKYEKFGHLNDCLELACCTLLKDCFRKFTERSYTDNVQIFTADVTPVWGNY